MQSDADAPATPEPPSPVATTGETSEPPPPVPLDASLPLQQEIAAEPAPAAAPAADALPPPLPPFTFPLPAPTPVTMEAAPGAAPSSAAGPPAFVMGALVPAPPAHLHAAPAPKGPASVLFLVVVTLLSLAADLGTKAWAKAHLSGLEPRVHGSRRLDVWKGHIELIFAQNPGGAWSFLRSLPDSLRRPFFLVVSAGAIVFIITIYQRVHRDQWAMKLGLPLALGGAGGNLIDRIRYGWVVDFIDFSGKWGGREHHWPTFNVADIAIVVGVVLMAIDMLRARSVHGHRHEGHAVHEGPKPAVSPISS